MIRQIYNRFKNMPVLGQILSKISAIFYLLWHARLIIENTMSAPIDSEIDNLKTEISIAHENILRRKIALNYLSYIQEIQSKNEAIFQNE